MLETAYTPDPATRQVPRSVLRKRHCAQLGNDWFALHRLWSSYFRIPTAIESEADAVGPLGDVLGVHYRGTDKLTTSWDTNPVEASDMIEVIRDFRRRRPALKKIFLATDDKTFAGKLREQLECEILNLGEVEFHKAQDRTHHDLLGASRALLVSLLLSRCGAVLKTSSALSGFAKIFNPELEIYRCAASKRFADIPYFPVAYIEPYVSTDPQVAKIVERLMVGDWSRYRSRVRFPRKTRKWSLLETFIGSPVG